MPSAVASLVYLTVMVCLFRRDFRQQPNVTRALWIPFLWLFINMSRFISAWLDMVGIHAGGFSVQEGSPVDALGSLILIVAGVRVLMQRRFRLSVFIQHNRWIFIFLLFCFLAVFWSDFMFVAFKRWVKILGQPIMVLVLLTEPDFETAVTVLLKRCAYVIVPLSFLFIKYYPQYGRGFSEWTGQPYNRGIALDKNALGADCLILGFFFAWYTLKVWQWEKGRERRNELILCAAFLTMIVFLFLRAQSSTSLVCCAVGVMVLVALGLPFVRLQNVGLYLLGAVGVCALAEYLFGVSDLFFQLVGRDRTLTDRVFIWQDCLSIPINPIIGVGFESFWLGERQEIMNSKWNWHPNEAHNGYLETYLNLGVIGLCLLVAMILATFWKARRELLTNFQFGRYRMAFLCALVLYNWTESSFKALHPMWFVFYIIALDYPRPDPEPETAEAGGDAVGGHEAEEPEGGRAAGGLALPAIRNQPAQAGER